MSEADVAYAGLTHSRPAFSGRGAVGATGAVGLDFCNRISKIEPHLIAAFLLSLRSLPLLTS